MAAKGDTRRRCAQTTAAVVLAVHKVQTRPEDDSVRYEPLSAIVLSEGLKLSVSLAGAAWGFLYHNTDASPSSSGFLSYVRSGHDNSAVPAFLYTLSATSQGLGAYHLDIISYLMLSQVKLILTPIFSNALLKQTLKSHQWMCLIAMATGMVLVQVDSAARSFRVDGPRVSEEGNDMVFGVVAMLVAGCCSAFASVYMEAVLKASERSFMVRNAQLAGYSCMCAIGGFLWQSDFRTEGFFRGYSPLVWALILLQAMGGFLVSWAVRIASTIAKNYAQSLGFLAASTIPLLFSHYALSSKLYCGIVLVLGGVFGSLWKHEVQVSYAVEDESDQGDKKPRNESIV
ncbi:UDP-galactose transporter [Colletotrichum tofieldiae]|uniref:UDP-galactose transporter n=1 Tax=Colletotrichum tofieldiae TaxID=708197 RepID=A0A166NP39_9PEZI|nr:UDP-galactose transporter [Colletotrichum tofieldiae]